MRDLLDAMYDYFLARQQAERRSAPSYGLVDSDEETRRRQLTYDHIARCEERILVEWRKLTEVCGR